MGTIYKQLGIEERERIIIMRTEGRSLREIGRVLGRSHSTIVRELKRNGPPVHRAYYLPHKAQERSKARKREAGRRGRLKTPALRGYVESKLMQGWSPEQIAGRWNRSSPGASISHEAVYQYVYSDRPEMIGFLARRHKERRPKGRVRKSRTSHIPNRIAITERPAEANDRSQFGHWESDSMFSRVGKAALSVQTERKSRYAKLTKVARNTAALTCSAVSRRLARHPRGARLSITYDNGSENARHEAVNAALGTRSYFCAPFHSWERGTVENLCGLIRRYVPKRTNIDAITASQIRNIERSLNNRPRKCLDYQTPNEVFDKLCGALPR
jgi:IS30 family transposase